MGSTRWSTDSYEEAARLRKAAHTSDFAYSDAARSTGRLHIHPSLDPLGATVRESRDSEAHPRSNAISILFDETGSMGGIPRVFQRKLAELMRVLLLKNYLPDPQILFGALGDATCDRVPLQIGQFESGVEMDEHLRNIILEGGGGGTRHESYELALYFLARHTAIDCWEKRGRKGYAFLIGDEKAYPFVDTKQVARHIGDELQEKISLHSIIAEVQRHYHFFFIFPRNASHGKDRNIQNFWHDLLGQNVIFLDDENAVCETIALTIGLTENAINLAEGEQDLQEAGADKQNVKAAAQALQTYVNNKNLVSRTIHTVNSLPEQIHKSLKRPTGTERI
ncbi:hypothetical protein [Dictyobacter arantiisoli]|uniref:VWFA domain-containing protein n=1 Tax=Dictyobacter arantiisoli TaxID=2014874 RepID=A0A5A5TIG4_9CHLR|nr:hypothetical protein [Dictyobacter arantiisoli]GCF10789.1 hypothetical protein KDI_43530 [Dictyobacter arantiisoli]